MAYRSRPVRGLCIGSLVSAIEKACSTRNQFGLPAAAGREDHPLLEGAADLRKDFGRAARAPPFVFYEGPPTANGLPHPGHCLTLAIKDLFPRYKTMRGYFCERKAGWDTHGLPVEVEVCKELGIHAKEEIEAFGVEPFIQKCIESVFRYVREWEELTERIGFWIHLDEAYVTFHQSYVESVWWGLKTFFERGLLYQGHKIVWWWAQGGTALSSGEVGQGYREVADPSVYVRFPLVDPAGEAGEGTLTPICSFGRRRPGRCPATSSPQSSRIWNTPSFAFAENRDDNRGLGTRGVNREKVGKERTVEATMAGEGLVSLRYVPPFDYYYDSRSANNEGQLFGTRPAAEARLLGASSPPTSSPPIPARELSIRPGLRRSRLRCAPGRTDPFRRGARAAT